MCISVLRGLKFVVRSRLAPATFKPAPHPQEFEKSCPFPPSTRRPPTPPGSHGFPTLRRVPENHWKLMECVSSLVTIYSVVHFKANRRSCKTLKDKNVKPSQTSVLLSQNTVEKQYVVHWRTLVNYSSAAHDRIVDTKHSFISSAGCYHAERISCKITKTWKF